MVTPIEPRNIIPQLKVCSWRYNDTLKLGEQVHYGMIAQDLLETFGTDYGFVDVSGQFLKVNYHEFIGPLIAIAQHQQQQLDVQEQRIQELETIIKTITHKETI